MERIGLGWLGLSQEEFESCTLRQFYNRLEGWQEKREQTQKENWEQIRWQTWWLVNLQLEKRHRLKLKDIMLFPWEKENEIQRLTKEQEQNILEKWDKMMKK